MLQKRYIVGNVIAAGTYGRVYEAYDVWNDNTLVALKLAFPYTEQKRNDDSSCSDDCTQQQQQQQQQTCPEDYYNEWSALCKLTGQPHIVQLRDAFRSPVSTGGRGFWWLVLEHMDMNLHSYLLFHYQSSRRRGNNDGLLCLRSLARHLLRGVVACHERDIIHCDLKPQNLLVSPRSRVLKLADFGMSRSPNRYSDPLVTPWYRAPELLLGGDHVGAWTDMWSVGCILVQMFNGNKPLFAALSDVGVLFEVFQLLGTPTEQSCPDLTRLPEWQSGKFPAWAPATLAAASAKLAPLLGGSEEGADLVARLLTLDPAQRISAADALRHPFLSADATDAKSDDSRNTHTKRSSGHTNPPETAKCHRPTPHARRPPVRLPPLVYRQRA